MKREVLGKRKRFEIFKRDFFECQYCGAKPPNVVLEIDHIIPISKGGTNDDLNLATACFDCNRGKYNGDLSEVPIPIKADLELRKQKMAQLKELNKFLEKNRKSLEADAKKFSKYWIDNFFSYETNLIFQCSRIRSLVKFLGFFAVEELVSFADIALLKIPPKNLIKKPEKHVPAESLPFEDRDQWRYFCGICWKQIKDRSSK